ncbi:MAG: zinc-ribbon domain-containing protein [Clostridia bacterium]|nr:zinc-ribbon domain-containing protein [Clostridia bacterium]
MKYCEKCGNQLLDEAVMCPKCGHTIVKIISPQEQKQNSKQLTLSILSILGGIAIIVAAILIAIAQYNYY